MTKLEVEIHDNVISVLHKLKSVNDTGIELIVPEGSVLFENILNLKLIQKWAESENCVISFQTNDQNGQNMLISMENGKKLSENIEGVEDMTESLDEEVPQQKFKMPKFSLSLPSVKLKKGKIIIFIILVLALLGVIGYGGYRYALNQPVANVKVIVDSQPLTRSLEIKVRNGVDTDAENKILKGTTVEASVEDEVTVETTGEKVVGEKAEGKIYIYNKTNEEKEFDDGTEVIYKDKDKNEYVYELKDDVTVPAREETPGESPSDPITVVNGRAEVEVVAKEVGSKYNIDKGEDLDVEDEDNDDFVAEVSEDIDGGSRDTVQIVTQEDLETAAASLLEKAEETAYRALDNKISGDQTLINGSESLTIVTEEYSHKIDNETKELTLKQTFAAKGLVYNPKELDDLIDELIKEFIPQDFVLSTKERSVGVEVLGNTDGTVLNASEADLQVTIRTYVVTDISENTIKKDLMGKNVNDAQKYLGSIKDIKTYEFGIEPHIPLFDFVPKDESRIIITLERE